MFPDLEQSLAGFLVQAIERQDGFVVEPFRKHVTLTKYHFNDNTLGKIRIKRERYPEGIKTKQWSGIHDWGKIHL